MKVSRVSSWVWLAVTVIGVVFAARSHAAAQWDRSVVSIEVARKAYDYYQPWNRRNEMARKAGVVVAANQVLTTAEHLSDHTLVRLQKGGRGPWAMAKVLWVDYYANVALLGSDEADFWADLEPARIGGKSVSKDAPLQIVRWREGKLENRTAEFSQFSVRRTQLSDIHHVQLEASSEIQGAGWGEPLVANSHLLGLVASQTDRTCQVIPASLLQMILEGRRSGGDRQLGYFHFVWQPAENPDALAYLKLSGPPRGVLVIDVPKRLDGVPNTLKPHDIILQIDGFDIDMQGDYLDPDYGQLMLENLSSRGKWAGDEVKINIWREGKALEVRYRLPEYNYSRGLVPGGVPDQEPEYLIAGGLVFQPLTVPYLQRWGSDWQRTAPFRLNYYREDEATKEQPSLVFLSQVLPDEFNIGYQEYRALVVDKVNDRSVHTLAELQAALKQPKGNFHIIDFARNEQLQRMVLAAGDPEREATTRILEVFGIPAAAQIAPGKPEN